MKCSKTEIELEESITSENTTAISESALYTDTNIRRGGSFRGRGSFRGKGPFRGRGALTRRFDNRNTSYPDPSAYYVCGKRGHRASNCFHNLNQKTCFSCGETTHISHGCKYTTLTQKQARKGRSAFVSWTIQNNSRAIANSTVVAKPSTQGSD